MYRRNIPAPSKGSKSEQSKKPALSRQQFWLLAWHTLRHWYEGDICLRNVGWFSPDYTALYRRRQLFIATAVRKLNATLLVLVFIADLLRISGGIRLNSKGRRKNKRITWRFPSGQCSDCGLLGYDAWETLWPLRWKQHVPLKRWYPRTRLHGVTTHKPIESTVD
jgi:hypothetical protein